MPTNADSELATAFDAFLDAMLTALADASVPLPETPAQLTTGALVAKMLRLADAAGTLARSGHPNDTAPTLRTMLSVYVNLKFICTYADPEAASLRYHRHLDALRKQMKRHIVRSDVPNEGFPTVTAEAWDAEDRELQEQWKRADKWANEHGVREMPALAKPKSGRQRGVPTWTGLRDADLFRRVGERDAYRFYSYFSNEIHANVAGIGEVLRELQAGRITVYDESPIGAPLTLAAKYVIRGIEHYRDYLSLALTDATVQRIADDFAAAVGRYPRR